MEMNAELVLFGKHQTHIDLPWPGAGAPPGPAAPAVVRPLSPAPFTPSALAIPLTSPGARAGRAGRVIKAMNVADGQFHVP